MTNMLNDNLSDDDKDAWQDRIESEEEKCVCQICKGKYIYADKEGVMCFCGCGSKKEFDKRMDILRNVEKGGY